MANLRLASTSKKLAPRFVGPFQVERKLNQILYELSLPDSFKIHPVFHVSLLKPEVQDPFSGQPEPVLVMVFMLFKNCRKRRDQLQYLMKWKGYGPEDNFWEPEREYPCKRVDTGLLP